MRNVRDVIVGALAGTNQFQQRYRSVVANALVDEGYDPAAEKEGGDDWVRGALAVLVTDGTVMEDPYSSGVSYYLPENVEPSPEDPLTVLANRCEVIEVDTIGCAHLCLPSVAGIKHPMGGAMPLDIMGRWAELHNKPVASLTYGSPDMGRLYAPSPVEP